MGTRFRLSGAGPRQGCQGGLPGGGAGQRAWCGCQSSGRPNGRRSPPIAVGSRGWQESTRGSPQVTPTAPHAVGSPCSQKLLRSPRKPTRKISKIPFKVLDAPELQDDFYLNLVDWSSLNVLSVGLGTCVYLWSACTSQVAPGSPRAGVGGARGTLGTLGTSGAGVAPLCPSRGLPSACTLTRARSPGPAWPGDPPEGRFLGGGHQQPPHQFVRVAAGVRGLLFAVGCFWE